MANSKLVQEWLDFSKMDLDTAIHLNNTMHPKPYEIICYHCQQSAEKILKAVLIANNVPMQRTHDLGLLAEFCSEHISISEEVIDLCDNLTPYGIKVRYPQELYIEEHHVQKAISDAETIFKTISELIK